jgi:hypothetical protein
MSEEVFLNDNLIDIEEARVSVSDSGLLYSILYAPPIAAPARADPARRVIRQLARQQSIELMEKGLYIADVLEADEIFLTNVIMEALPVVNVERHTVGDGKAGPVTKRLREGFLQEMEQQCRRQE